MVLSTILWLILSWAVVLLIPLALIIIVVVRKIRDDRKNRKDQEPQLKTRGPSQ